MSEGSRSLGWLVFDAVGALIALAVGIGTSVSGDFSLSVLCLFLFVGLMVGGLVVRRGSQKAKKLYATFRPLVFGSWLVALAMASRARNGGWDWTVILVLGLAYLGLGVAILVALRRIPLSQWDSEDDGKRH
jgi:hypothetical protein